MQKTSLHFGKDRLTYATMARETLTQPDLKDYKKEGISSGDRALLQRTHNYSMGYVPKTAEN